MTKFGMETEHEGPCYVYSDHKLSDELMRDTTKLNPQLIDNKKLELIKGLSKTFSQTSHSYAGYSAAAFKRIVVYNNPADQLLGSMGLMHSDDEAGVVVCKTCLQNAILACEEVLQTLKDIQDVCK